MKGKALSLIKTVATFAGSSIICWLVDYFTLLGLTALFTRSPILGLDPKLPAIVIARALSSFLNYMLNRRVVFRSGNRVSVLLYYLTVLLILGLNYGLLRLFTGLGIPLWLAQLLAQGLLYPLSFLIQKKVVFREGKKCETPSK